MEKAKITAAVSAEGVETKATKAKKMATETGTPEGPVTPKRGRPKKTEEAPARKQTVEVPKAPRPEEVPAPAQVYEVVELPVSKIEVDYSKNPRFHGSGSFEDHAGTANFLAETIRSTGQLSPVEGYFPQNDRSLPLQLTEGFRRMTAFKVLEADGVEGLTVKVHVIPAPASPDMLLGRQLAANGSQLAYTVGEMVSITKKMLGAKDVKGKPLTKSEIAREFGMTPPAFNQLARVAESGKFSESVERGELSLNAAYMAVKQAEKIKAEMEARAGMEPGEGEAFRAEAEDRVARAIEGLEKPTASAISKALGGGDDEDARGFDNPVPAKELPRHKTDRLGEVLNQLKDLDDKVAAYVKGKDTVPSEALTSLMQLMMTQMLQGADGTLAEGWETVEAYLETL